MITVKGEGLSHSLLMGKRFYIAFFLFCQMLINYVDRVNLSIAAPAIAKHFHWDPAVMGWVFSAYLWTYIIFLVPNGWWVDRFGSPGISGGSDVLVHDGTLHWCSDELSHHDFSPIGTGDRRGVLVSSG